VKVNIYSHYYTIKIISIIKMPPLPPTCLFQRREGEKRKSLGNNIIINPFLFSLLNYIMRIECDTEEQLKELKERAMKCKVIALDNMGKHPLYNPRNMSDRDRKKLTADIEVLFRKDEKELDVLFNEIACDRLFSQGLDPSAYPVYEVSDIPPPKSVKEDPPDYEGDTNSPIL
jgi:hypothetical protein